MRYLIGGSLAAAFLLVGITSALGASGTSGTSGTTEQSSSLSLSTKSRAKSAGVRIAIASTDQSNTRNRQPKRMTNFDVTLPSGTSIDTKTVPQCRAGELDFEQASDPDDACPRGSKVGTGRAAIRLPFPGTADVVGTVSAYNANKGLLLFINFPTANQTLLLRPKFRGVRLGTPIPQICVPPARPENNCTDGFGNQQEAILVQLSLNTTPKSHRGRLGVRRLIRTPRFCPSRGWTFRASFKYADGTGLNLLDNSSCRRP